VPLTLTTSYAADRRDAHTAAQVLPGQLQPSLLQQIREQRWMAWHAASLLHWQHVALYEEVDDLALHHFALCL
jgi:hypothetical protein